MDPHMEEHFFGAPAVTRHLERMGLIDPSGCVLATSRLYFEAQRVRQPTAREAA